MEMSASYYRRKELMAKLEVPLMGEVKEELGEQLASVVFKQCPPALEQDMGLKPTLDGPGAELWVSPSDLLIPKVCLKPPLTSKTIRALTHEGILEIGECIDRRYWLQMENEKAKAIEDQRALLLKIAERERRVAIKLARHEERELCMMRVEQLMLEFESRLEEELKRLEEYMLEIQDKAVQEALDESDKAWIIKLEDAAADTVSRLTEQFLQDLDNQKKDLESNFRMEFIKQQTEFNFALSKEHEFCESTLRQLRHCLECKNLANLMYVLCMERRKCGIERCSLEYIYKNKISDLQEELKQKTELIADLTAIRDRKQRQLEIREECLLEILKQFQKFINFALRSAPTQAEFLLSVEKMILFEVARQTWVQPKKVIKHLAKQLVPWKSDTTITERTYKKPKVKAEVKPTTSNELEPPDYHKCLEEIIPPEAQSDILPYFYYKDKMYIRGDLEAIFAQKIEMSQTNMLWNTSVENLMQILRANRDQNITEKKSDTSSSGCGNLEEVVVPEQVEEPDSLKDAAREAAHTRADGSRKSVVSFHSFQEAEKPATGPKKSALSKKSNDDTSTAPVSSDIEFAHLEKTSSEQEFDKTKEKEILKQIKRYLEADVPNFEITGLLAAQDSLATIRLSRKSSLKESPSNEIETGNCLIAVKTQLDGGNVSFEHFEAVRILDEIELTRPSNRSSKTSLAKQNRSKVKGPSILSQKSAEPHKVTPSQAKLLQTIDSLIIHRNSLMRSSLLRAELKSPSPKQSTQASVPPKQSPQPHQSCMLSHGSLISKLSVAKDSLELIRKQSLHSKKDQSGDDVLLLSRASSKSSAATGKYHKVQKVVSPSTISHIEVAKIPTDIVEGAVNFSPIHEVYETNILKTSDSPWKIYQSDLPSMDNFVSKRNEVEVVGDQQNTEYRQPLDEFTGDRVASIMSILKQDPSLIRLFTGVTH